jgi:uncharacterized paraquat-inducible protein A
VCYRSGRDSPSGMATCPRCKGHLTDNHRCPRRPLIVGIETTLAGLAGAFVALLVVALTVPQGRLIVDLSAMLIGALAGIGLDRYVRG